MSPSVTRTTRPVNVSATCQGKDEEQQKKQFKLQEEVLAYKLSSRKNIINTFTQEQRENLYFLLGELQMQAIK